MFTIVKKEMLEALFNPRFAAMFAATSVLILFSVFHGYFIYSSELQTASRIQELSRNAAEKTESYQFIDVAVVRKPDPLTIFDIGLSTVSARVGEVETNSAKPAEVAQSRSEENPVLAASDHLDLTRTVGWILSLIAILIGHNLVCGEKGAGTLKLLTLGRVSRTEIILGKVFGNLIPLYLLLVVPLLLSLLWLTFQDNIVFNSAFFLGVSGLTAIYILYTTVFILIGMLFSSITRSSFSSLMLSLSAWALLVILLPRFSAEVAPLIAPEPSIQELEKNLLALRSDEIDKRNREIVDEINSRKMTGAEFSKEINDIFNQARHRQSERLQAASQVYWDEYYRQKHNLISTTAALVRVSPMGNLINSTHYISGNGADTVFRFRDVLKQYSSQLDEYSDRMYEEHKDEEKAKTGGTLGLQLTVDDNGYVKIANTTRFDQSVVDLSEMPVANFSLPFELDSSLTDIALLLLYNGLLLVSILFIFQRYDVR
jgi:ABC-type transport system involved in multi-copper enzyme maturation permease subunit